MAEDKSNSSLLQKSDKNLNNSNSNNNIMEKSKKQNIFLKKGLNLSSLVNPDDNYQNYF